MRADDSPSDSFLLILFLFFLAWALWAAGVGWTNTISDAHGFRQAQTAITSYYLLQGGPFLDYETPVLGAPWSVPFEFPLYQGIVAAASGVLKSPLEQTGRAVSEVFFWLTVLLIWPILGEVGIRPIHRLAFLTLLIVSPQYVFWSRTFLMESTAVCLGTAYVLLAARYTRTHRIAEAALGGVLGAAAAGVKATTFPGFALIAAFLYLRTQGRKDWRRFASRAWLRHGIFLSAFAVLPVLAAFAWTRHADSLKALNVVGARITSSSDQLRLHTYGDLDMRLSGRTWAVLLSRTVPDVLGSAGLPGVWDGVGILALWAVVLCLSRRRGAAIALCGAAFLSAFLLFTSVHLIHNYYAYANGIFLIGAAALCIVGALEHGGIVRVVGIGIFLIGVSAALFRYYDRFYEIQKANAVRLTEVSRAVERITDPRDVILIFGQDWSSEIPFYSRRRALMWPLWMPQSFQNKRWESATARLGSSHVGALLLCGPSRTEERLLTGVRQLLGAEGIPAFEDRTCAIYRIPGEVGSQPLALSLSSGRDRIGRPTTAD